MATSPNPLRGVFSEGIHQSTEPLEVRFALAHAEYLAERTQQAQTIAAGRGGVFDVCSDEELLTRAAIDRVIETTVYSRIEQGACASNDIAAALNLAHGQIVNLDDKRSPQRTVALQWLKDMQASFAADTGALKLPRAAVPAVIAATNPSAFRHNERLNEIRGESHSLVDYIRAVRAMDPWTWDSISIGQTLNGFSNQPAMQQSEAREVAEFLAFVTERMQSSPFELRAQAIHNCFCAVSVVDAHLLNSDGRRIFGAFIGAIADKVRTSPEMLSDQDIGQGMHRLRNVELQYLDVAGVGAYTKLLEVMADKIAASGEPLSARTIGSSLHALKAVELGAFSWAGKESLGRYLSSLAAKVEESNAVLNAVSAGGAMYGLHNIELGQLNDSGRWAFGRLLYALSKKVAASPEPMNRQAVTNCLYGLRNVDPQLLNREGYAGLCISMEALATKLDTCTERFDRRAIADALTGIRNINPAFLHDRSREAYENLLIALSRRVSDANDTLDNSSLSRALFGLKGVNIGELRVHGSGAISDILDSIGRRIPQYTYDLTPGETAHALFGIKDIEPARLNAKGQAAYAHIVSQLAEQSFSDASTWAISQSMRALSSMAVAGAHTFIPQTYARLVGEVSRHIEPRKLDTIGTLGVLEDILALQHLGAADLTETADRLFAGLRTEEERDPYMVLGLIQTYSLYGKPIPESLHSRYQDLELPESTDSLEAEVVKRISEEGLLPDARSSAFYNGFEFDIASKPARINIELDGRHHTAGFYRVRDELRDKFIEGFRWRVVRVKVRYGMSTDEIVDRVRAALVATPVGDIAGNNSTTP